MNMIISFKHLWTSLITLATLSSITAHEVALGCNLAANETGKQLPLHATSFIDLISKSVFVDKTLLIDEILTRPRQSIIDCPPKWLKTATPYTRPHQSVITCPPKWGKTINLDMLRSFVNMEVHPDGTAVLPNETSNYRIFVNGVYRSSTRKILLEKPLLIADEKYSSVVEKHLGKHPTIYLSFSNISLSSEKTYKDELKQMICKAFKDHEYLLQAYDITIQNLTKAISEFDTANTTSTVNTTATINTTSTINTATTVKLTKNQKKRAQFLVHHQEYMREVSITRKEKFHAYLTGEETDNYNLTASIRFLSQSLRDHFNKKVFLFIDDYDRLLATNDSGIVQNLLLFTLKYNEALGTAILTGTVPMALKAVEVQFEQFPNSPLIRYYGFIPQEMDLLYEHYQVPADEQTKIEYWYGGYEVPETKTPQAVMHPWILCNYLNSRKFESYQRDYLTHDVYLNKICQFSEMQYKMSYFFCGKNYWVSFEGILDPLTKVFLSFSQTFTRIYYALRYLISMGYLAKHGVQELTGPDYGERESIMDYDLKIPNYQNSLDLQNLFVSKLDRIFEPELFALLQNTTAEWENFLSYDETTSEKLQNYLQKCFESFLYYSEANYEPMTDAEALFHAVFMSTVSLRQYRFVNWKFMKKHKISEAVRPPDIVLTSKYRGVIIDVRYDENITSLMKTTMKYLDTIEKYFAFHGWKDVKVVFCSVMANETVKVISDVLLAIPGHQINETVV